jgi:hypothetical protein
MYGLLNLQSQISHDGFRDLDEVRLSQVNVSDLKGSNPQGVLPCLPILLHEPASLQRKENPVGGASIKLELASEIADLEMGFFFGKTFQDVIGTDN